MNLSFDEIRKAPKIARIRDICTDDYYRKVIQFEKPPIFQHNSEFIGNLFSKGANVVFIDNVCTEIFSTTWGMIDCFTSFLPEHYNDIELKKGQLIAPLVQWENKYNCLEILSMIQDLHLFCEKIRDLYCIAEDDNDILKSFGLD